MLSGHHRIIRRRNIAENFNGLSRVHERYRRQTTDDRRQTDRQTTKRQTDARRHIANMNMSSRSLKIGQKGAWPRSRATSSYHDLLNKQATEALRLDKIRESIAFDFQHGYRMWTWFVNFLDKKAKINFKN